jgi:glycosyltransferase involved in cell wall biosynthesis
VPDRAEAARPGSAGGEPAPGADAEALELSVVLPCLNEADTLEPCITRARSALERAGIRGEIVVADNGSHDGSVAVAERLGARVVRVAERGYGSALMGGIGAARGRWVLMADADASYDLLEIPRYVEKLRQGFALVQGCRLPSGGGRIAPGAMPPLHRWLGNPLFTALARRMFRVPVHDAYCGMRAFSKELYERLALRCTGMEFAIEMLVKASLLGAPLAEVPITLHPDRRRAHGPHLRTFRDGWRTLRFLLVYSPRWLFLVPGALLLALGALGWAVALPGLRLGGVAFDAHTLLVSSLALLLGYQSLLFALFAKTFGVSEGLLPEDPRLSRFFELAYLERGLVLGGLGLAAGVALLGVALVEWGRLGFGDLDYARTMRWVVPGVTLVALGFQTVLASFLVSLLGMGRR